MKGTREHVASSMAERATCAHRCVVSLSCISLALRREGRKSFRRRSKLQRTNKLSRGVPMRLKKWNPLACPQPPAAALPVLILMEGTGTARLHRNLGEGTAPVTLCLNS